MLQLVAHEQQHATSTAISARWPMGLTASRAPRAFLAHHVHIGE
jgi:hypothetical protein